VSNSEASAAVRPPQSATALGRLRELATLLLKLGTISFGGPAAHIALIESEIVGKRQPNSEENYDNSKNCINLDLDCPCYRARGSPAEIYPSPAAGGCEALAVQRRSPGG